MEIKKSEHIIWKKSNKRAECHNPVMTQRFGADPYALVYQDRVYLYMTGDNFMYDAEGNVKENDYTNINTINVISSDDLVNWADHGSVYAASGNGQAVWGENAWAPAAAYKEIDGKMKFFLYFANGGNGIAVLSADSPIGPFTDPIKKPLISREISECADVTWLFDPAVLVDEDGSAYLYFGGGVPSLDKADNPGTARMAKLGKDMISIEGRVKRIEGVSYFFEDSGINKINGKYIYSYCSNFSVPEKKVKDLGFGCGEIITMESEDPMGAFMQKGSILKNPESFFGLGGNNHHCLFQFRDKWYMAYHARLLEAEMGIFKGYRSTNLEEVNVTADGSIMPIEGTMQGVSQAGSFSPYKKVLAATMAVMAGITTIPYGKDSVQYGCGEMIVSGISTGSWLGVYGVDFEEKGAGIFYLEVRKTIKTAKGAVRIYLDSIAGKVLSEIEVTLEVGEVFSVIEVKLPYKVTGKHDLYFGFLGEGYEIRSWEFQ